MGAGRVACDLLHSDGDAAHPITGIAREALQAHSGPAGAFTALGSVRHSIPAPAKQPRISPSQPPWMAHFTPCRTPLPDPYEENFLRFQKKFEHPLSG